MAKLANLFARTVLCAVPLVVSFRSTISILAALSLISVVSPRRLIHMSALGLATVHSTDCTNRHCAASSVFVGGCPMLATTTLLTTLR